MAQAHPLLKIGSVLRLLAALVISASTLSAQSNTTASDGSLPRLEELLRLLRQHYVDPDKVDSFVNPLIDRLLNSLDPHTFILDPEYAREIDREMQSTDVLAGYGFDLTQIRDTLAVYRIIPATPASRIGMLPNDRIFSINGIRTLRFSPENVDNLFEADEDGKVTIVVYRPSTGKMMGYKLPLSTARGEVTTSSFMLNDHIGYIRFESFTVRTVKDVVQSLEQLENAGMKQLVMDLRENGGGLLNAATHLVDLFLPGRGTITTLVGRNGREERINAFVPSKYETLPLVVLVDNNSASASEVFAAAMQDNDLALIIGKPTYGKGLVQQQYPLSGGSAFRITTSRWYAPSGRWIQKKYEGRSYLPDSSLRGVTGDNLKHQLEFAIDSEAQHQWRSAGGRPLSENQGIVPDYVTTSAQLSELSTKLLDSRVFSEAVTEYLDESAQSFWEEYKDEDPRTIRLSRRLFTLVRSVAKKKNILIDQRAFANDSLYYVKHLKGHLTFRCFGHDAWNKIFRTADTDLDQAVSIIEANKELAVWKNE